MLVALVELRRGWAAIPPARVRLEAAIGQLRRFLDVCGRRECAERILTDELAPELAAELLDHTAILAGHVGGPRKATR